MAKSKIATATTTTIKEKKKIVNDFSKNSK